MRATTMAKTMTHTRRRESETRRAGRGHQVDGPLCVKFERYVYSGAGNTYVPQWHTASVIYLFIQQQVATLSAADGQGRARRVV